MNSLWRNFRYAVLLGGFVLLGAYLFMTTPWHEYIYGKPTYSEVIVEGQPIVDALYRFKTERGLWPQYIEDLFPDYLPQRPDTAWYYTLTPQGPSLAKARSTDKRRTHIGYDFDPRSPTWRAFGDSDNRVLQTLPPPATSTSAPSSEQRLANSLAELDRRIVREPGDMDHWRHKVSILRKAGRIPEAQTVIQEALTRYPANFWPRLALAALQFETFNNTTSPTTFPDVTSEFDQWTKDNPSYSHSFYLSVLHRLANNDPAALATLEKMPALPMQLLAGDDQSLDYYAWDASRFALAQQRWDLVVALCDQWQKTVEDGNAKQYSFLPIRAAARLALGDFDKAQADVDRLRAENVNTWSKNEPALEAAIKAKDKTFRYPPGPLPAPYSVFAQPE